LLFLASMTAFGRSQAMLRKRIFSGRSGIAAISACVAVVVGVSGCGESARADIDSVQLRLAFGGGVTLSTVDYVLTGPVSFRRVGTLAVGDQDTIAATFNNLPVGQGYDVVVRGTATDDASACRGEAMFNVAQSMNAVVQIALMCSGRANVAADIDVCPTLDSLSVAPAEVYVGSSVQLTAAAHDPDNGPAPLMAAWAATSGTLGALSTMGATFTCTTAGTFKVGVTVSDGTPNAKCADSAQVTVVCTPPPSASLLRATPARQGAV
jgi:hypothetical protein